MSRIPPAKPKQLADSEQEALARAERLMGFSANDALVMARNPRLMHAFSQLVGAVYATGEVPDTLKRMVGLMTSSAAGCRYCVGHTTLSSGEQGVDDEKLAAIWEFESSDLFSDAERAALRVALHAGQSPNGVTDEMFAELARYYGAEAQLEIVAVIAMFGFLNRWNSTLATELEDKPAAALARAESLIS